MSTTDEATEGTDAAAERRRQPDWVKPLRRYGPFVAIVALVVATVAVFGGNDGGDDREPASEAGATEEGLIRSGPMTPQKAALEGAENVDFGLNCDTGTGRIKLPTVYAPPCVEPFEGDNGGATYPGVTEDSVKVVVYDLDPALDPLGAALIGGAGVNLDPEIAKATRQEYADVYNGIFETYGRRIDLDFYTGTGASDDETAAKADAIAIAEMEPFAVIGGPLQQSPAFADEITARGILCLDGCALALPESFVKDRVPLVWQGGMTPNQAAQIAAEAIGKLAGPGQAEFAGDPETRARDRVYAVVHYDTPDGLHEEAFTELRDGLAGHGIQLASDVRYELDLARLQESARTIITQLKEAGVTTIVFYGDPLTPASLTGEATAQDYRPEWILGPNLAADTAIFGRTFDQEQWVNGFGVAIGPSPGSTETTTSYQVYEWAYGTTPPVAGQEPALRRLFTGVSLAGPDLTPESFRDGLYRYPPSGGGPTRPLDSRGQHGLWPEIDYGADDDITLIWWDPDAESTDEAGNRNLGSYRFANGGQRYALGELPDSVEESGLFDVESSAVEISDLPAEDRAPDYPPPDLPSA